MCLEERYTDSRLRSPAACRNAPRTRPVRRMILSLSLLIARLRYFFLPSLRKMRSSAYLMPLPL